MFLDNQNQSVAGFMTLPSAKLFFTFFLMNAFLSYISQKAHVGESVLSCFAKPIQAHYVLQSLDWTTNSMTIVGVRIALCENIRIVTTTLQRNNVYTTISQLPHLISYSNIPLATIALAKIPLAKNPCAIENASTCPFIWRLLRYGRVRFVSDIRVIVLPDACSKLCL